jgi:hypothetical protein
MDIAKTIRRWWADRRGVQTYGAVKSPVRNPLSADIGVATHSLGGIVADGSQRGRELPHLLQAVDLDLGALSRSDSAVMRDMAAICSTCQSAAECRVDLCNGVARKKYFLYCPNTDTIDVLISQAWEGSAHV